MAAVRPPSDPRQPTYTADANQVPISPALRQSAPSSSQQGPQYAKPEQHLGPPAAVAEHPTNSTRTAPRPWRISALSVAVHVALAGWTVYSVVCYSIAIRNFGDDAQRQRYASAFLSLSVVALLVFAANSGFGFKLPRRLHLVQQCVLFVASAALLTPALFNLAFVSIWRRRSPLRSTMALSGRCSYRLDLVWAGTSGQCNPGVSWGAFLAGAIARFLVTLFVLIAMHCISWVITMGHWFSRPLSPPRPRSHSTVSLVGSRSNKLRRKQSSQPTVPPLTSDSASSSRDHRRTFSSGSNNPNSQTLTYVPNHFTRPQPPSLPSSPLALAFVTPRASGSRHGRSSDEDAQRLSPTSGVSDYYSEVDDGGDLNRFAANFRTLVERVSRETEDASRLPSPTRNIRPAGPLHTHSPPSAYPPRSPSPHGSSRRSSFQTNPDQQPPHSPQDLQRDLLNAHRLMLLEQAMRAESYEHVLVLGGAVRRMSTIPSVANPSEMGDGDQPPWTPTSGMSSYATPRELTRSPTSSTARSVSGRRNPIPRHYTPPSTETSIRIPPLLPRSDDSPERRSSDEP